MKRRPPTVRADTHHVQFNLPAATRPADALNHNPYVDSFPRTSPLSPYYGASFPPSGPQVQARGGSFLSGNRDFRRGTRQITPQRTTKTTQKLVLFPDDTGPLAPSQPTPGIDDNEQQPWYLSYNEVVVPDIVPDAARTEAERMSKDQRTKMPRVTSYCIAEGYKIGEISKFLRNTHQVSTKKYDECLYVYYEPEAQARFAGPHPAKARPMKMTATVNDVLASSPRSTAFLPGSYAEFPEIPRFHHDESQPIHVDSYEETPSQPAWMLRGEVFIFDYGVAVFWNFSEEEETAYLKIIRRWAVGMLPPDDVQNEDFHYQYDLSGPHQPRIFNDMITLKSGSSLIKLTISHGLAQSVKLAFFENVMEETIDGTIPLPRTMAQHGEVRMTRTDIMKIVGQLFKLRMNVNLISNVLDTPELFWSEPELEGLYNAIRGYLEISQRAKLLNTRADIISDLLDMLTEHMNSNEMTYITWIIIILIVMAVIIAAGEVWVKALRLRAGMED
ncbi:uncharacterized protein SPPG_07229 [Spizellomyces punctatus DAOM BR117]|uniref:DUF155 domain-containing protein n=1 Tax=Spizellomyces punctatus (strain DAOM BR117) TaxID=645134 RepID=A0A0L0H705_SPIPD|nr:uncharacterized protein SPPG_07229 [Spizellomyces punctatus DAOM BR117]KNC97300.1 hypothetical protein SPPG_07229 [Spizellomyces punctatus DAOM BR117]|eukprot:XP_016605340.1 hypothetical protein SPPG_07229 [Spizellomyces punctatus DAOM BR117]